MEQMSIYDRLAEVPENAKKTITGGRLNGFTDINPQWRIEKLTEVFGPCGFGWWYKITDKRTMMGANDEEKAFVDIELYVKIGNEVSQPIPGTGGSTFVEKGGKYTSDECFKMALTDAISVAAKALGLGADIYRGCERSKYTVQEEPAEKKLREVPPPPPDIFPGPMEAEDGYYYCDDCGQAISGWKSPKTGKTLSPKEVALLSIQKYGGAQLCMSCAKNRR